MIFFKSNTEEAFSAAIDEDNINETYVEEWHKQGRARVWRYGGFDTGYLVLEDLTNEEKVLEKELEETNEVLFKIKTYLDFNESIYLTIEENGNYIYAGKSNKQPRISSLKFNGKDQIKTSFVKFNGDTVKLRVEKRSEDFDNPNQWHCEYDLATNLENSVRDLEDQIREAKKRKEKL